MTPKQFDIVTDVLSSIVLALICSGILLVSYNYVIASIFSLPTATYLQVLVFYVAMKFVINVIKE